MQLVTFTAQPELLRLNLQGWWPTNPQDPLCPLSWRKRNCSCQLDSWILIQWQMARWESIWIAALFKKSTFSSPAGDTCARLRIFWSSQGHTWETCQSFRGQNCQFHIYGWGRSHSSSSHLGSLFSQLHDNGGTYLPPQLLLVGSMEDGKKLIQNGGSDITAIAEGNGIRTSRWLFDSIECGKLVDVSWIRSSGTIYAPS